MAKRAFGSWLLRLAVVVTAGVIPVTYVKADEKVSKPASSPAPPHPAFFFKYGVATGAGLALTFPVSARRGNNEKYALRQTGTGASAIVFAALNPWVALWPLGNVTREYCMVHRYIGQRAEAQIRANSLATEQSSQLRTSRGEVFDERYVERRRAHHWVSYKVPDMTGRAACETSTELHVKLAVLKSAFDAASSCVEARESIRNFGDFCKTTLGSKVCDEWDRLSEGLCSDGNEEAWSSESASRDAFALRSARMELFAKAATDLIATPVRNRKEVSANDQQLTRCDVCLAVGNSTDRRCKAAVRTKRQRRKMKELWNDFEMAAAQWEETESAYNVSSGERAKAEIVHARQSVETITETGWRPKQAGRCRLYWLPGVYGGYVFAPQGAKYELSRCTTPMVGEEANCTNRSEPLRLADPQPFFPADKSIVGLGSVGVSWAPVPYVAVLLGVNYFRIYNPDVGSGSRHLLRQLVLSVGGTLDIFNRLLK